MQITSQPASFLVRIGQFQWLRAHVSTFLTGSVALVSLNLLIGSGTIWALTLIGIWAMLLLVHGLLLIMARLVVQLQDDDSPEVRLPVNNPLVRDSTSTWIGTEPPAPSPPPSADRVSWQAATDAAQMRRSEQTTPESNA